MLLERHRKTSRGFRAAAQACLSSCWSFPIAVDYRVEEVPIDVFYGCVSLRHVSSYFVHDLYGSSDLVVSLDQLGIFTSLSHAILIVHKLTLELFCIVEVSLRRVTFSWTSSESSPLLPLQLRCARLVCKSWRLIRASHASSTVALSRPSMISLLSTPGIPYIL